jgi:hypothetical protein
MYYALESDLTKVLTKHEARNLWEHLNVVDTRFLVDLCTRHCFLWDLLVLWPHHQVDVHAAAIFAI